jgi:hypothetical protein
MRLSAPKQIVFIISLILLIVGFLGFIVPAIPLSFGISYWLTFASAVLLVLGCLLKGF